MTEWSGVAPVLVTIDDAHRARLEKYIQELEGEIVVLKRCLKREQSETNRLNATLETIRAMCVANLASIVVEK